MVAEISELQQKKEIFSTWILHEKKKKITTCFLSKEIKHIFLTDDNANVKTFWEPEQQLRKQALSTIQSCQCFTLLLHFWFYTQIIEIENFRRTWEMFLSNCCWIKKLSISIYRQGPVITNNKNEIWVIVTGSTFLITPTLINY